MDKMMEAMRKEIIDCDVRERILFETQDSARKKCAEPLSFIDPESVVVSEDHSCTFKLKDGRRGRVEPAR